MNVTLRRALAASGPAAVACWPELLAGVAGGCWFFHLGYANTLSPRHVSWMFRADWFSYLCGFVFFRNAPWGLPLGNLPNLYYPHGTSVAFTDANPIASLPFKVVSPLLARDFQPFGLWFFVCYVLQAVLGVRITRCFTRDRLTAFLGGCLFGLTPLIPVRYQHIALSGVFFVTAGIYLQVRPANVRDEARRAIVFGLAMLAWASGTHGYLSVMVLGLVLAFVVRLGVVGVCSPLETLALLLASLGVTFAMYWLVGYVGTGDAQLDAWGFGVYSADIAALVNPQGWSNYWPGLPYNPLQWEGFAYLGAGALALVVLAVVRAGIHPVRELRALLRHVPLLVVLAVMAFYSLSNHVTYLGREVENLDRVYAHLGKLPEIFRSTGRFQWPIHLALLAVAVRAAATLPWRMASRGAMALALLVQGAEIHPKDIDFSDTRFQTVRDPAWRAARGDYDHLRVVPPQLKPGCARFDEPLMMRTAYLAYRERLTFNGGYIMRTDAAVGALCDRHVPPGEPIDPRTVYVVTPPYMGDFLRPDAACGRLDGLVVCVAAARETALRAALTKSGAH